MHMHGGTFVVFVAIWYGFFLSLSFSVTCAHGSRFAVFCCDSVWTSGQVAAQCKKYSLYGRFSSQITSNTKNFHVMIVRESFRTNLRDADNVKRLNAQGTSSMSDRFWMKSFSMIFPSAIYIASINGDLLWIGRMGPFFSVMCMKIYTFCRVKTFEYFGKLAAIFADYNAIFFVFRMNPDV